jgi:hypothetical protein
MLHISTKQSAYQNVYFIMLPYFVRNIYGDKRGENYRWILEGWNQLEIRYTLTIGH